ncbi:MAG: N-acetylmuramoyl-L-alanine amidase [Spirochaetaceae bacterium]|jgi:N-acetylmuramoyl-L-alanine amidase|nr:N-acetylmuramoyl-L-alanine amidase [Spirochaetaceae bacterium]
MMKLLKGSVVILLLLALNRSILPAQTLRRERALSLDEILGQLGGELSWDPFFRTGIFTLSGHSAAFETGGIGEDALVVFDGREIIPVPSPYIEEGSLRFPESFAASLREVLDRALREDLARFRIAAIVVDPGHGGKDTGAVGTHRIGGREVQVAEKDITLRASRELHKLLVSAYPDKRIFLTREADTYPTLEDRVSIANSVPLRDNEAILFISVHANASLNKAARGFEVWYLTPEYQRTVIDQDKYGDSAELISIHNAMMEDEFTTESIMMAQFIINRLKEAETFSMPSRGIKAEEWFVVRNARMPSVLVELGFVTNEEDSRIMTDEGHLKKLSEALYKGIVDFVTMFERSGGFTALP